jgi:hypothetical protein|tara:strand:+ start:128 stop:316 length:189 start_codon:yes stop_codon:yes gene_type:complete
MADNPFVEKPIDEVKKDIHSINHNLNTIKVDVMCIASEIKQLKELLKEREAKKAQISKGWIW